MRLSWRYFAMNFIAFGAIYALFPNNVKVGVWVLILLLCALSVTMGIWVFSSDIHWYIGLSGALHGLLVTLIIVDYVDHKHGLNILLLLTIIANISLGRHSGAYAWKRINCGWPGNSASTFIWIFGRPTN